MPVIQGTGGQYPIIHKSDVISFADSPGSPGTADPDYELVSCRASSSANDLPQMTFRLRTGTVKQPHAAAFSPSLPTADILGKWVNLRFGGTSGFSPVQFVGIVVQEQNILEGNDANRTGSQQWLALGLLHLLRKINVSRSFWDEDSNLVENDRVASFNQRDELGMLVGNRSAAPIGGSAFIFGGTDTWTRRQALDYLLERFAGPTGFTWKVDGQTNLVDVAVDHIELGQGGTLANAVRRILSPSFGLDFTLVAFGNTIEIRVFSLSARDVTYQGVTIPLNPKRTRVALTELDLEQVTFTRAIESRYAKVRLRGARAVAALTLDAAKGDLVPKWPAALRAEYLAGTGTPSDSAAAHDQARSSPRLETVFTTYGAPSPSFSLGSVGAGLGLDLDGAIISAAETAQSSSRETLRWTPMRDGYDYSSGGEVPNIAAGHEADFKRPAAWVYDEEEARFFAAEFAGISVAVPRNDWGIVLQGDQSHRLALGLFGGAADSEAAPEFDQAKIVATIAVQTDVRLTLEAVLEDGLDDGTVLEIEMPGAELWVIAAGTVVGVNGDGTLQKTSGLITVRDDRDRMAALMAGIMARYLRTRARAKVVIRGWQPWASAIGTILTTVVQGGNNEDIGAAITQVDYMGGEAPRTVIKAGYER